MAKATTDRPQFAGPVTAEALARLDHLLRRPFGCGVVLGPARSGKSAMLRNLAAASSRSGAQTAPVDGQGLDGRGLMWELAAQWRIAPTADGHSRRLAQGVRDYAHGATAAGERLAILVDHADRLEPDGARALVRLLHEFECRRGLTVLWSAETPVHGDIAEQLLPFTELRIESPATTSAEAADFARAIWGQTADINTGPLSDGLARQIAALSKNDLRRAERLSRLSQLAARAEERPLDEETLSEVAGELA